MVGVVLPKNQEKYWITYIKRRIQKKKNFLGFLSGPTGSGKSYSSLRIGEELDPDFSIDRVVFSGKELMTLINTGNLKSGSCIVFEECGVEMSNRNWASIVNKMLNYLMQTFRHRRLILIFNSPYMDFLDSATRKLLHAEFVTIGIDYHKKEVKLKPQTIQYNSRLKKFYYKRLKVIKPEGKVPVSVWRVGMPSKELLVAYENKKRSYTDKLNKKIFDELEAFENKGKEKKQLTEIQQETVDMLKKGLSVKEIASRRGRAERVILESVKLARKKGYLIEKVFEDGKIKRYAVTEPNTADISDISS